MPRLGNKHHPLHVVPDQAPDSDGIEAIDRIAAELDRLPARLTVGQRRLLQVIGREMRRRGRIGHAPIRVRSGSHQPAGWLHELYCEMPTRCTC